MSTRDLFRNCGACGKEFFCQPGDLVHCDDCGMKRLCATAERIGRRMAERVEQQIIRNAVGIPLAVATANPNA